MSRVFLIMPSDTAAVVQGVIQARLDELNGIRRTSMVRVKTRKPSRIKAERSRLKTVVGQLEEPA